MINIYLIILYLVPQKALMLETKSLKTVLRKRSIGIVLTPRLSRIPASAFRIAVNLLSILTALLNWRTATPNLYLYSLVEVRSLVTSATMMRIVGAVSSLSQVKLSLDVWCPLSKGPDAKSRGGRVTFDLAPPKGLPDPTVEPVNFILSHWHQQSRC